MKQPMNTIEITGARTHNLKNISLSIPRDKLTVITGLSGSGKSSLAFDTLYAEGQRRYVESLSSYARQFLDLMDKPDVDSITGLSPAISIEQKSTSHNPRSTVGTITEIHDYLRLLFARAGEPVCPTHHIVLKAQTVTEMTDAVLRKPEGTKIMILAPVVRNRKGEYKELLSELSRQGYIRAMIDGELCDLSDPPVLKLRIKHTIEVVVDRLRVRPDARQRIAESFETALKLADGIAYAAEMENPEKRDVFSEKFSCPECGYSISEIEPRLFSFNNPSGACPECGGLGQKEFIDPKKVLRDASLSVHDGAIRGWDHRSAFAYQMLEGVAKFYGFSLEVPYSSLSEENRQRLWYGTGTDVIDIHYESENGSSRDVHRPFEGIVPNMERRLRETTSSFVRQELMRYLSSTACGSCHGTRLREEARNIFIDGKNLPDVSAMSIRKAYEFFSSLNLPGQRGIIAARILQEIRKRLGFLVNVGLDYLTLSRSAETLSGGESQRIRLASQIGAGLVGVMYVLDEPSIGLHQRDNDKLIKALKDLRDLGNSVIVVEHDEEMMREADMLVDIGPGPGIHGGKVVAAGTPEEIMKTPGSITGDYLAGRRKIEIPVRHRPEKGWLRLYGASGNNLKSVDLAIPEGLFTCVTGVSGSGKSTLINETLYKIASEKLNGAINEMPLTYGRIEGLELFDKVIDINQNPIGRTPRSNPATYTGLFTEVRELFASVPESRARGYGPGRFSFNVKGGRCEACQGDGVIKVEMNFLPDVYVPCEICHGQRYNRETLEIKYKGKNISEVLHMTVEEALEFFSAVPGLKKKLQTLCDVGMSYVELGQSATTFSGGEAQRIKLATELARASTGRTLYILDEPTTGLHFEDIRLLLSVLMRLRDAGNTVIVIEHNLDVIKTADWIVDLGPEGGERGGTIVTEGVPEDVARCEKSYTAKYLRSVLKNG